jgi:hypothetical protein
LQEVVMPLCSIATAAFALASLVPIAAHATATAHIVQGPLATTLVDLDPDDGVAPSLSFQDIPTIPERSDIMHWRGNAFGGETALGGYGNLDRTYDGLAQSAHVLISGAKGIGMLLDVNASTGLPNGLDGRIEASATSSWLQFLLSPHTEVRLGSSAQASGSVSDMQGDEYARAQSELNVKLTFADGSVGFFSDGRTAEASTAPGKPTSFDEQQLFDITFRNNSDATASGYLYADAFVWVYATAPAPPVPEPAAAWMLAPGLLLVALRARRRRYA